MRENVFISYSSTDKAVAAGICAALERQGWRCWMAPRNIQPGTAWPQSVAAAVRGCQTLVLVLSPRCNLSQYVLREVHLAVKHRRHIIPYLIEPVELVDELDFFVGPNHWLDAVDPGPLEPTHLGALISAVGQTAAAEADWTETLDADASPDNPSAADGRRTDGPHRLRSLLVEAMVDQQRTTIDVDPWWQSHRAELVELLRTGVLAPRRSVDASADKHVVFADVSQWETAVMQWAGTRRPISAREIVELCMRLAALTSGLARFLVSDWDASGKAIFKELVQLEHARVVELVAAIVRWLDGGEKRPAKAASVEVRRKRAATLAQAVDTVLDSENLWALTGLAHGVQQLLELGRLQVADDVYSRLDDWGRSRDSSRQEETLLLQVANERGRVWLQRNQPEQAEIQFRRTLRRAEQLGNASLVGVVTNNLARSLLDQPAKASSTEIFRLLQANLARLAGDGQRQHLAVTRHNLGDAYCLTDPVEAERNFRADVEICQSLDDPAALADALDRLGVFLSDQKRFDDAQAVHRTELEVFERLFDLERQSRALANLGRSYLGQGYQQQDGDRLALARDTLHDSAELYSTLDDPRRYAPTLENLGRTMYLLGDVVGGVARLQQGAAQYDQWPAGGKIAEDIRRELRQLESTSK